MNTSKKQFIAIEGTDLIGKTTAAQLLAKKLSLPYKHFPGLTGFGKFIRTWRKTTHSEPNDVLYYAEMISEALTDKKYSGTVYDRHFLSNIVYHNHDAASMLKSFDLLCSLFEQLLESPVLFVILYASEELLAQRFEVVLRDREDYFHKIEPIFKHNALYKTFGKMLELPIITVDNKTPEQITDEIFQINKTRLEA
jgi:thymidylate kinase